MSTTKAKPEDGGCGVKLERTASKRDFYIGIALVGAPRLAADNTGVLGSRARSTAASAAA